MSFSKKYRLDSTEGRRQAIQDLLERVDTLEKMLKVVYHKQNSASRTLGSTLHNMSSDITNANRKITQAAKG